MSWKKLAFFAALPLVLFGVTTAPATSTAPASTSSTRPATASTKPAMPKSVTLQIRTMDFKNVADNVMNKLLNARFSGTTSDARGLVVRPVERTLLEHLRQATASLQSHPHDITLAIKMMQDLNYATFMADVPTGNRGGTGANEKTALPFLRELRDEAAGASSVMAVVNVAGSAQHLLTQQAVNADGDFAVTATTSKPQPWLNGDSAQDKRWISQLTALRDAACEILEVEQKNDDFVDLTKPSPAVTLDDGYHLEGVLVLAEGALDKGRLTKTKIPDGIRTTGKPDADKLAKLLDKLDNVKAGGRYRYTEFVNADQRLLNDAVGKPKAQILSIESVTFKIVPGK